MNFNDASGLDQSFVSCSWDAADLDDEGNVVSIYTCSLAFWQSGRPLGPVQNKGGLHTNLAKAAKTAWQYLNSVWQNCLNAFEQIKGFNATTFQNLLTNTPANGGITWLDDTDPSVANSSIGSYGGTNTSTNPISSLFQTGADAVTLPGTTDVAIGPSYFTNETQTQQIAIAIHEALHVALGQDDNGLYSTLSQFGFTQGSNSGQITDWIVGTSDHMSTRGGGCKNP